MSGLNDEEHHLMMQLSDIEQRYPNEIIKQKYDGIVQRLSDIQDARIKAMAAPVPTENISQMEKQMRDVLRKIGAGAPKDAKVDPWGLVEPQKIFEGTRKWHLAAARVFEYFEAQLNMDLFKGDPEATQIFRQLIVKGFQVLQNEANANYGRP